MSNSVNRLEAGRKPASAEATNELPLVVVPDKKPEPEADFNWNADDGSIILPEQPETAAYFNRQGSLVIRQRAAYPDDDVIIIIAEANLDAFLDKLTDICGIPSVGKSR